MRCCVGRLPSSWNSGAALLRAGNTHEPGQDGPSGDWPAVDQIGGPPHSELAILIARISLCIFDGTVVDHQRATSSSLAKGTPEMNDAASSIAPSARSEDADRRILRRRTRFAIDVLVSPTPYAL
jgi:hypothetical protein